MLKKITTKTEKTYYDENGRVVKEVTECTTEYDGYEEEFRETNSMIYDQLKNSSKDITYTNEPFTNKTLGKSYEDDVPAGCINVHVPRCQMNDFEQKENDNG